MNIAFRVDSSFEIGTGHVSRCLTLADMLHTKSIKILFLTRNLDGNMSRIIEKRGYKCILLQGNFTSEWMDAEQTIDTINYLNINIDLLIIDHYGLGKSWETQIKKKVRNIMVVDDLANRKHRCDVLLDQNYYENYLTRYNGLVPTECIKLLGPKYLLLRPEFHEILKQKKEKNVEIKRIFIFYGGSDPTNETEKALLAIKKYERLHKKKLDIDVVVGESNKNKESIRHLVNELQGNYYCQIDFIAELMWKADLSFGAGGVTMWERCYLKLPSIVTAVAENQVEAAKAAAKAELIIYSGWYEDVNVNDYYRLLLGITFHPPRLVKMKEAITEFFRVNNTENEITKTINSLNNSY